MMDLGKHWKVLDSCVADANVEENSKYLSDTNVYSQGKAEGILFLMLHCFDMIFNVRVL